MTSSERCNLSLQQYYEIALLPETPLSVAHEIVMSTTRNPIGLEIRSFERGDAKFFMLSFYAGDVEVGTLTRTEVDDAEC